MSSLQISIPQRMGLLRITLVLSLLTCIALSINLWAGWRTFPVAPVFEHNPIQPPFDIVFIGVAIMCWLLSLFLKGERAFIFVAFLMCFFLVLFDMNRLQPWFYCFNALLAVFIFYNGRVDDPNRYTSIFILLQIIVASAYFFSGLSQLNPFFLDASFEGIIAPLKPLVSGRQFLFLKKMGFLSPYLFMFTGLALTISPIRYLGITVAVFIHTALFILLFPSASNTNYALWISNPLFIIMIVLLFSGKTKQRYFSPAFLFQMPLFYVVLFLFVIMPCFNTVNKWPDYLSFNFRSGNNNSAVIRIHKTAVNRLPLYQRHFCVPQDTAFAVLDYRRWIAHELHADYFPGEAVFNSIYNNIRRESRSGVKEVELQLQPKCMLLCKP